MIGHLDITKTTRRIPQEFFNARNRLGILPSRWVLIVYTFDQKMDIFVRETYCKPDFSNPLNSYVPQRNLYKYVKTVLISTSRFGIGEIEGSYKTPIGLHRIAQKIGNGYPIGTVFKSRKAIGYVWKTHPSATIVHRIMWLEGLEPGLNCGGNVDSFKRYIYIHGYSDETTIGKPASCGCIHVGVDDLLPIFDTVPEGTLVFITGKRL